ncbi:cell envelope biogenesis protein TonB [Silvimonas amylolytica]|uniref:Cell envelope biogenesis protein TonB n=2 Tax=Silvimonas amylolytica TaxID=449663 RepID=A0ABQ2PKA8_9NEIS|nr:cell envelope biogenesis protein TonB [Silvimonas amylolytica]
MLRNGRSMTTGFAVSALAHAAVILGIGITHPEILPASAQEFMQVELVNKATDTAPSKAKVRAQVNQDAGGNTDADKQVSSPLPAQTDKFNTELQQVLRQEQQLEQDSARLMTQLKAQVPATIKQLQDNQGKNQQSQSNGSDDQKREQQVKELSGAMGKIDQNYNEYQQRPRKVRIGLAANKSLTALWESDWKEKIERMGANIYPKDATGKQLYGQLTLTAEINQDGSLRSAVVDRSSGDARLDKAALGILQRSAPFSRLPKGLVDDNGNHASVLVVTRRWSFTQEHLQTLGTQ